MKSINRRLESLENTLIKGKDWNITREWFLCVIGGVPLPNPQIEYFNWSLKERLDALTAAEDNLKATHEEGYQRRKHEFDALKDHLLARIADNRS